MVTLKIRHAEEQDFPSVIALARQVAETCDTFPWEGFGCDTHEGRHDEEVLLAETWLPEPGQFRDVFVGELEDADGIAGLYVLQPNGLGRCRHIAQGAYLVTPALRGRGIGKQLCRHSLQEAKNQGYSGMQFDMVVSTNIAAVKAWTSCGFKIMCTLPRVFRHPQEGLVDAHIMFHDFSSFEASGSAPSTASTSSELPATFGYTDAKSKCLVGEEVNLSPQPLTADALPLPVGLGGFKVEPPLPPGLSLCPATGTIRGCAQKALSETKYRISAEAWADITLQVDKPPPEPASGALYINEVFAQELETIVDIADMPKEPARIRAYGDWMIWMVHRAHLNDSTLVDFCFNGMHMPPPHLEKRLAPKLVNAVKSNTHIQVLSLTDSNLQKSSGVELAAALRENCTLKTLNLEANCLDSSAVRELALSIRDNPNTHIEHLRLQHQRQMGPVFGRPAEEAVGQMMQKNETLVKLGFECQDAHWRNVIDSALVRNNDALRKKQQMANSLIEEPDSPSEERSLGQLALQAVPRVGASDFFSSDNSERILLRSYLAQNLQLPTTSQLQHYAKNTGTSLSYTTAGPLIKQCRTWLLDTAITSEVLVIDAFGMSAEGKLKSWCENGDRWTLELCDDDGARLLCKSEREPAIFLAEQWSAWLSGAKPVCGGA